MHFTYQICCLTDDFYRFVSAQKYSEIMADKKRPYFIMINENYPDVYICSPFRTNVHHKECYRLPVVIPNTAPAIDYSKTLLLQADDYIGNEMMIDKTQYKKLKSRIATIANEIIEYIDLYQKLVNNPESCKTQLYRKKFRYTTLKYFTHHLSLSSNPDKTNHTISTTPIIGWTDSIESASAKPITVALARPQAKACRRESSNER